MLTESSITQVTIKNIEPTLASDICHSITTTLPEWFGIPEANARYIQGMFNRTSFAAYVDNEDNVIKNRSVIF